MIKTSKSDNDFKNKQMDFKNKQVLQKLIETSKTDKYLKPEKYFKTDKDFKTR